VKLYLGLDRAEILLTFSKLLLDVSGSCGKLIFFFSIEYLKFRGFLYFLHAIVFIVLTLENLRFRQKRVAQIHVFP
jgi:hypothetical protein